MEMRKEKREVVKEDIEERRERSRGKKKRKKKSRGGRKMRRKHRKRRMLKVEQTSALEIRGEKRKKIGKGVERRLRKRGKRRWRSVEKKIMERIGCRGENQGGSGFISNSSKVVKQRDLKTEIILTVGAITQAWVEKYFRFLL